MMSRHCFHNLLVINVDVDRKFQNIESSIGENVCPIFLLRIGKPYNSSLAIRCTSLPSAFRKIHFQVITTHADKHKKLCLNSGSIHFKSAL